MCLIDRLISTFSNVGFKDKENKKVVYFTSHGVQFVCFSTHTCFPIKMCIVRAITGLESYAM
jgi:uncharacterized membrane protein YagU involved in acid resistance